MSQKPKVEVKEEEPASSVPKSGTSTQIVSSVPGQEVPASGTKVPEPATNEDSAATDEQSEDSNTDSNDNSSISSNSSSSSSSSDDSSVYSSPDTYQVNIWEWKSKYTRATKAAKYIEEGNMKPYYLFLNQCSPGMLSKIKSTVEFEEFEMKQDGIGLLGLIREVICGVESISRAPGHS